MMEKWAEEMPRVIFFAFFHRIVIDCIPRLTAYKQDLVLACHVARAWDKGRYYGQELQGLYKPLGRSVGRLVG